MWGSGCWCKASQLCTGATIRALPIPENSNPGLPQTTLHLFLNAHKPGVLFISESSLYLSRENQVYYAKACIQSLAVISDWCVS